MTKRILVVDDDDDLREAVTMVLRSEGYEVDEASGGAEGLAKLRSEGPPPDLVLLDLMMPGLNGWQFREKQCADRALADIPVVVFTASRSLHLNPIDAQEIVFKPLEIDDLLAAVARHC